MVVVLLAVGTAVVVFVLWDFLWRGGYVDLEEFPDSVEHAHLRRVAEARISGLCPGAIRLAVKERAEGGTSGGVSGGASGGDPAREFWRRFAAASALVEEDPIAAIRELRGLSGVLEEALLGFQRGAGMAEGVSTEEGGR